MQTLSACRYTDTGFGILAAIRLNASSIITIKTLSEFWREATCSDPSFLTRLRVWVCQARHDRPISPMQSARRKALCTTGLCSVNPCMSHAAQHESAGRILLVMTAACPPPFRRPGRCNHGLPPSLACARPRFGGISPRFTKYCTTRENEARTIFINPKRCA